MKLSTKARIYRWTSVYLAQKEEEAYLLQPDTRAQIMTWANNPDLDMDYEEAHGLAIGVWQCDHRFVRPISFLSYKWPRWFWAPIGYLHEQIIQIRWACGRQ